MLPPNPHDPDATEIRRLRLVGGATIAGVVLVGTLFSVLASGRPALLAPEAAWLLCGAALLPLAISFVLDASSPGRRLAVLALREATGLIGAVLTLLTGELSWVAALATLSVAGLAAALPRQTGLGPR